jgi:glutathione S-transferase
MTKEDSLPILYSFVRCPYAMRARMALYSAKISHEHREVDLKNKCPELLSISPKGTVPVLELADKTVIEQSLDIMNWALKSPLSALEKDIIEENDNSFKDALDRYKYPTRYDEKESTKYRDQCVLFINKIEDMLDPFISGKKPQLVDMALFPFVRQFVAVDSDWINKQPYPKLKKWVDYFACSDLFHHVMKKYPFWSLGDKPTLIILDRTPN